MFFPRVCNRISKLFFGVGMILLLIPQAPAAPSFQQPAGRVDSARSVATLSHQPATLVIQNRPIVVFRATILYRSPQERVESVKQRIAREIDAGNVDSVAASQIPEGTLITIHRRGVFLISPVDVDSLAGETLEAVSQQAVHNLTLALQAEREQRSVKYLLQAIGLTILATIIFVALLWLISRGRQYLRKRLPEIASAKIKKITFGGFTQLHANKVATFVLRLIDLVALIAGLFITYSWLTFSLRHFPYTRPWGEALRGYLFAILKNLALAAIDALPGLLTILIIFIVTRFLIKLVKLFFVAVETGMVAVPWLPRDTALPTRRIMVAVLWLFALVVAYPYLPGSSSDAFKGVSVFVGLMLSLGSSGLISQMISGLLLTYSRALRPGEYVRIGDTEGLVTSLGVLSTKIKTIKREEVTIPNSVVVGNTTKNFSRLAETEGVILYTSVTIGYSTPWRQVDAMLVIAAERTPGLKKQPPPFVNQTALSDFYVEYQLNAYMEDPKIRIHTLSLLHANIQDVFNEHGVQIMSPHYWTDPPAPVWVPKEKWYEAPAKKTDSSGTSV